MLHTRSGRLNRRLHKSKTIVTYFIAKKYGRNILYSAISKIFQYRLFVLKEVVDFDIIGYFTITEDSIVFKNLKGKLLMNGRSTAKEGKFRFLNIESPLNNI